MFLFNSRLFIVRLNMTNNTLNFVNDQPSVRLLRTSVPPYLLAAIISLNILSQQENFVGVDATIWRRAWRIISHSAEGLSSRARRPLHRFQHGRPSLWEINWKS